VKGNLDFSNHALACDASSAHIYRDCALLEVKKHGYSAALISSRGRLRDLNPEMVAFYKPRRDVHHR
jgi:hypothetical protein